jgi:hypothetical protein
VPESAAAEKGAVPTGEIGEDKTVFRLVQENHVKQVVDLLMGHVIGGDHLSVSSRPFANNS